MDGRVCSISVLIEIYWVSSHLSHLANSLEFDVRDAANTIGGIRWRDCELSTVLRCSCVGRVISLEHYVAIKESNFCLNIDCVG